MLNNIKGSLAPGFQAGFRDSRSSWSMDLSDLEGTYGVK